MTDEPTRLAYRPRDRVGRPVPWFTAWVDGSPDFRLVDAHKIVDAVRFHRCWVCGQGLGRNAAFTVGPMCAVNRVSAEPPSHRDCAIYSATNCPFLTKPHMHRRESAIPEGATDAPGVMLRRNPGACVVWVTRRYRLRYAPGGGLLFDIGEPVEWLWFAEGRRATRAEVDASIESGLPLLREQCELEDTDGRRRLAHAALDRQVDAARFYLPTEEAPA